jgi:hypothetical protein
MIEFLVLWFIVAILWLKFRKETALCDQFGWKLVFFVIDAICLIPALIIGLIFVIFNKLRS